MKTLIIDMTIIVVFLVAICTVGKSEEPKSCPLPKNCYATCRQFESALLVGCYLADRDKTKSHKEHEDFCKKLAKEFMGKDSGCK